MPILKELKLPNLALPLFQTAWVVTNIEEAARGWLALGVGPFLSFDVNIPDALYRGRPSPLATTVAMAQAGDMQIELIVQHSQGPSAYRDSVPVGASAMHHVCREFGKYDVTVAQLKSLGVEIATEAVLNGSRFCYADTRAILGCMLEVVDDSVVAEKLKTVVREAAIGWDGSDPFRTLSLV